MKLKHPESKQTVDADEALAEQMLTQGWEEVGSKSKSESADAEK